MKSITYYNLKGIVIERGFSGEINSIQNTLDNPVVNIRNFFFEYIWVVVNSGMKNQIASKIYNRIIKAIYTAVPIKSVFGHEQKTNGIQYVYDNIYEIYEKFVLAEDKLEYLDTLPFIGKATKYHLARNLGFDVCKPDRHLLRIAKRYKSDPNTLCKLLAKNTGDKVGIVDLVIWRAANLGFV